MKITSERPGKVGRNLPHDENLLLSPLFNGEELVSLLNDIKNSANCRVISCRPKHVRYQPQHSCTVLYEVGFVDTETKIENKILIYARSLPLKQFTRHQADLTRQSFGNGIILKSQIAVPELQAIFYEFPHDERLPQLRLLSATGDLKELLVRLLPERVMQGDWSINDCSDISPLRYKPENRLIVRCRLSLKSKVTSEERTKDIILRFERQAGSGNAFTNTKDLREALCNDQNIEIPEPLFASEDYGLSAYEAIEAAKLSDMLRGESAPDAVKLAARAAAVLHSLDCAGLQKRNAMFHLEKVKRAAEIIGRCIPFCRNIVIDIIESLNSLTSSGGDAHVGFVHGDYHQGQLLHRDGKTWVLDFDRAYIGDCTADIGCFLGQMKLLELRGRLPHQSELARQFIEHYETSTGWKLIPEQIVFSMVLTLVGLASRECRRLKPGWIDSVGIILNSSREILDRNSVL